MSAHIVYIDIISEVYILTLYVKLCKPLHKV